MIEKLVIAFSSMILLLILNALFWVAIGTGLLPLFLVNIYIISAWVFSDLVIAILIIFYLIK